MEKEKFEVRRLDKKMEGAVQTQTYYAPGVPTGFSPGSIIFIDEDGAFTEVSEGLFYDQMNGYFGFGTNSNLQGIVNIKGSGKFRSSGWDASLVIDAATTADGGNGFPAIIWDNVELGGGAGFVCGTDGAGSNGANEIGEFYFFRGLTGQSEFLLNLNNNIGVDGVDEIIHVYSDGLVLIKKTQALGLPSGTTAQRPSSPSNGFIRFNTDLDRVEAFYSGVWNSL